MIKLDDMIRTTLDKFLYPHSLVKEYNHWILLVRPIQVTLGSLILINKDESKLSFGSLDAHDHIELNLVLKEVEKMLKDWVNYDKINYLMLMMSDPEVHFHIIPRYKGSRSFNSLEFPDQSFPTAPDLSKFTQLNAKEVLLLSNYLKSNIK
jgi:diadenosine tetraphosphate (Ap4A) HIT family hydrolase